MKFANIHTLFASAGILAATLLSGCVDPYAQTSVTASVSNYRPGYEIRTLPPGYRVQTVQGVRYYYHNGTYYQPRSGRYVVVSAPHHVHQRHDVIVRRLPNGYRVESHRGRTYYRVNSTYYERRSGGYIIVGRPY